MANRLRASPTAPIIVPRGFGVEAKGGALLNALRGQLINKGPDKGGGPFYHRFSKLHLRTDPCSVFGTPGLQVPESG